MTLVSDIQSKYQVAKDDLQRSIEEFNLALTHGHQEMDAKTFETVQRIEKRSEGKATFVLH